MFYDIFYDLMTSVLGATQMATAQGQMIAQYGAYVFCGVVLVSVFSIALKIGDYLINLFRN